MLQQFREGAFNTLVATSVGEEGLDIGDVDLIVCFDAQGSSTRLVQRMGRTGRKRSGRVVQLLTRGAEEQAYKKSLSTQKSVSKAVTKGGDKFRMYEDSPRMVPTDCQPQLRREHIDVGRFIATPPMRQQHPGATGATGVATGPRLSRLLTASQVAIYNQRCVCMCVCMCVYVCVCVCMCV